MKEHLIDAETGWVATRESVIYPYSGMAVIEETVTDPLTGEVYRSSRAASYARPLTEWIRQIQEGKFGLSARGPAGKPER
jgi:hypothetical protein